MKPIHTFVSYSFKIHFHIFPHVRLGLSNGLAPSGFPAKFLIYSFQQTVSKSVMYR